MASLTEWLNAGLPRGVGDRDDLPSEAEWQQSKDLGKDWDYKRHDKPPHSGIFLGYGADGNDANKVRHIASHDDRHLLTICQSRGGKGVSLINTNLLTYGTAHAGKHQGGSVLAIDPKGELAQITCRCRDETIGQQCFVLDPFKAVDWSEQNYHPFTSDDIISHSFNPLDELDRDSEDCIDGAAIIADALIVPAQNDPHWGESARMFVRALILMALARHDPNERNLVTVRNLLMLRDYSLVRTAALNPKLSTEDVLYGIMKGFKDTKKLPFAFVIEGMGAAFATLGTKERGSILSAARTQTEFLDSPRLQRTLKHSDFKIAHLKTGFVADDNNDAPRPNVTVYLCLPAKHLGYYSKWLRVIINLALSGLEGEKNAPDIPVLFVLDEFGTAVGYLKSIATAAGLIAGSGVKLWTILQDLTQLQEHYKSWETFIGNAGVITCFGLSDATTLEYLSKKLGTRGMKLTTQGDTTPGLRETGSSGEHEHLQSARLLEPQELERAVARESGRLLVMKTGERPFLLRRAFYYREQEPHFYNRWKGRIQ